MSIIYEALKKVEKSQATIASMISDEARLRMPSYDKAARITRAFLPVAMVILGFFIANFIFELVTKPAFVPEKIRPQQAAAAAKQKEPAIAAAAAAPVVNEHRQLAVKITREPMGQLVLNGLFFSENKGYALINNQILKEGDEIDGAIVRRITLDGAELQTQTSTIQLSNNR